MFNKKQQNNKKIKITNCLLSACKNTSRTYFNQGQFQKELATLRVQPHQYIHQS